jgi:hypothetical protein
MMREDRVKSLTRKRQLLAVLAIVAVAVALVPLSALAGGQAKVDICHVNGVSDPIPTFNPATDPRLFYLGQVISVAEAAVPAHEAHGDSTVYRTDEGGLASVRQSAADNGLAAWTQADCFITR